MPRCRFRFPENRRRRNRKYYGQKPRALTAVLTVKQDKISIAFVPADTTASMMDGGEFKGRSGL